MNLEDLGNIADFLGAIAVLVTLVYLAIQVRHSTATTRAQTRQSLADSQITYLNSRVTDPCLRAASFKMYAGQELEAAEAYALRVHILAHIRLFENYYAQYVLGTMNKEDWRAMRAIIANQFKHSHYQDAFFYWKDIWNAEFASELAQILSEVNAQTG